MIIWDTETTGIEETDAILSIAAVDGMTGAVLLDTLVRPPVHLVAWPLAESIHGITPDMVAAAPTMQDLWPRLLVLLGADVSATYNAPFDVRLLAQSLGGGWLCDERSDGSGALLWHEDREDVTVLQVHCLAEQFAATWPGRQWSDRRRVWRWSKLVAAADFVQSQGVQVAPGRAHSALWDAQAAAAVWRWLQLHVQ